MTYIEQNFDGTYRRLLSNIDLQLVNLINDETQERLNSFNTLQENLQTIYQSIENINNSTTDALNKIDDVINKTSSLFGTGQNGNYNKNLSILGRLYADAFYVQNTSGPSIVTNSTDLNPNLNAEYLQGFVPEDFVPASHKGSRGELEHGLATATEAGFLSPQDFLKIQGLTGGGGGLVTEDEIQPLIDDVEEIKGNLSQLIDLNNHIGSGGLAHAEATETSAGFLSSVEKVYLNNLPSAMEYIRILSESNQLSLTGHIGLGGEVHPLATKTIAGFMSAADKAYIESLPQELNSRFDNVNVNDENFNTLKSNVESHIGLGGELQHPNARPELSGFMSAEDKIKLDGIEINATKYIHPPTHPASMIETNVEKTFVSELEKNKLINLYTKEELDNKFAEIGSGLIWKASVQNYGDIQTNYPTPEDGWAVNVEQDNSTYLYTGEEWIKISGNSYSLATESTEGLMSASDKVKLNNINVTGYVNLDAINSQFNALTNDFATKAEINDIQDKLLWVDGVIQAGLIYEAGEGIEITGTTIAVENSGVVPGQYTKVAVNEKGQVIAGYNIDSITDLGFEDVVVFDKDQNGNILNTISIADGTQLTSNNHLTNKKYVDDALNNKGDNILRFYGKALADSNTSLTSSSIYVIDGVTIGQGEKIVLTNQINAGTNGIYKVVFSNNTYSLVRDDKMPSGLQLDSMVMIFVEYGTKYAKTMWGISRESMPAIFTVGTHPMYIKRLEEWMKAGEGIELSKNISGEITVGFKPTNAGKIAITDSSGIVRGSNIGAEKVGYLVNVTSDIQEQINNAKKTTYSNVGIVTNSNGEFVIATGNLLNTTTNQITSTGKSVTANQVGYLANLTADIQKQINDIKTGTTANNDSFVSKTSTSSQSINYGLTISKNAIGDILPENGLFFVNEQGPQINFRKDSTYYYMYFKLPTDSAISSGAKSFVFLNDAGVNLFTINNGGAYIKNKAILTSPDSVQTINYPFRISSAYTYDLNTPAEALVTKGYVDARINSDYKESVSVASTVNITSLSGVPVIDGYQTVSGDRVLLKNQTTASQNGIWIVSNTTWVRPSDFVTGLVSTGCQVYVHNGTLNGKSSFVLTTNSGIIIDTTSLVFEKLATTKELISGAGINIGTQASGNNVISINQAQAAPLSMPTPVATNGYRVVVSDTNGYATQTALPTLTEINHVSGVTSNIQNQIGSLSSLNTTAKGNLVAAINELFQSASNGKQAISQALTGWGLSLTGTESFSDLAGLIQEVQTGNGGGIRTEISSHDAATGQTIVKGDLVEIQTDNKIKKAIQERITTGSLTLTSPVNYSMVGVGFLKVNDTTYIVSYIDNAFKFKIINFNLSTGALTEGTTFTVPTASDSELRSTHNYYATNRYRWHSSMISSNKFILLTNNCVYNGADPREDVSFVKGMIGTISNGNITFGPVQTLMSGVPSIAINKLLQISNNKLSISYTQRYNSFSASSIYEAGELYLSFIKEENGVPVIYKQNKLTNATHDISRVYNAGWGITHDKLNDNQLVIAEFNTTTYDNFTTQHNRARGPKDLKIRVWNLNADDSVTATNKTYTLSNAYSKETYVSYTSIENIEIQCISDKEFFLCTDISIYSYSMQLYLIQESSIERVTSFQASGTNDTALGWNNLKGERGLGIKCQEGKALYSMYQELYLSGTTVFRDTEIGVITKEGIEKCVRITSPAFSKIFYCNINDGNTMYMINIENSSAKTLHIGVINTAKYKANLSSSIISIENGKLNRHKVDGIALSNSSEGTVRVIKKGITTNLTNVESNKIYYGGSTGAIVTDVLDKKVGVGIGYGALLLTINPINISSEAINSLIFSEEKSFSAISTSMYGSTQTLLQMEIPVSAKIIDVYGMHYSKEGYKTFIKTSSGWNATSYSVSTGTTQPLYLTFSISGNNFIITRNGTDNVISYAFTLATYNIKIYE